MLKKFVSFLLILSFITPFFYAPYQAKRAEAFLGFGDIVVDVKALVERITDGVAMVLAQALIDRMVASTVKWAQSGFEGNPAYVTSPGQFFTDIGDGVAGEFIQGSDLGFLCSPFQANIRISLTQQYYEPEPFQCTLTDVVGNIEDFYDDFGAGGWDAWFSMTQVATNNPYDAYLKAKIELDSRLASAVGIQQEQLDWNGGFLSWSDCTATNPEPWIDDPGQNGNLSSRRPNPGHVPGKAVGECISRGPTKTPGSVIQAQLSEVLPSGLKKLQVAQHIDQLISAFASGLLTRYVFGPKGLFARNEGRANTSGGSASTLVVESRYSKIDLDGDRIPEGQDMDRDELLNSLVDVCFHGGNPPNCVRSVGITSTPYFEGFCRSVENTITAFNNFIPFAEENRGQVRGSNFRIRADAEIWASRIQEVNSSIESVVDELANLRIPYFDNTEVTANRSSFFIGKMTESLIKDGDMDLSTGFGSGGGGVNNLITKSRSYLDYFTTVKRVLGRCEVPNAQCVAEIPPPPETDECPGPALPLPPGSPPDMSGLVNEVARSVSPADTIAFRNAVVERLHAEDANFGYNGKRGNPNDLSTDALAYLAEGSSRPTSVHIIDFIVGSDGPNPQPGWIDVTEVTYSCGGTGYYVYPLGSGGSAAGVQSTSGSGIQTIATTNTISPQCRAIIDGTGDDRGGNGGGGGGGTPVEPIVPGRFYLMANYPDALDASNLTADLDYLRSKGFDGIRVFPNWWNWNASATSTEAQRRVGTSTLFQTSGALRAEQLTKLRRVIEEARTRNMYVDVTFSRETVPGTCTVRDTVRNIDYPLMCEGPYKDAVIATVDALENYDNVFFDLKNGARGDEPISYLAPQHLTDLIQRVRSTASRAFLSVSYGITREQAEQAANLANLDLINWHLPQGNVPATYLAGISQAYASVKPTYLSEPYPSNFGRASATTIDDLVQRAVFAKRAGVRVWAFNTQAGFDLDRTRFENNLTTLERSAINGLQAALQAVTLGSDRP